jgi:hypothetical protein
LNINCRPQQISVPSYAVEQTVQPITTAKTTTSTSNRNGTQYDPAFYSIYDDDSEIYKDVGELFNISYKLYIFYIFEV